MTDCEGRRLVAIGRLGRPHGLRGEQRLDTLGSMPGGLGRYDRFYLGRKGSVERVELASWRTGGRFLLVKIAGDTSRDDCTTRVGQTLYVERGQLPELGEGEYYHADVLGCAVVEATTGEELGVVGDIQSWGEYDMLTVESQGESWMLPVIDDYVVEMDLENGRIKVSVPEGLGP